MYLTKENIMNSSATILVRSSFVITTISTMTLEGFIISHIKSGYLYISNYRILKQ